MLIRGKKKNFIHTYTITKLSYPSETPFGEFLRNCFTRQAGQASLHESSKILFTVLPCIHAPKDLPLFEDLIDKGVIFFQHGLNLFSGIHF